MYIQLGVRLKQLKARKDAADETTENRLRELQEIASEAAKTIEEPQRLLGLTNAGEYGLFTVLRANAVDADEKYLAESARSMVSHLRAKGILPSGWSNTKGGRMRVEQSLLAESWNVAYAALGFNADESDPQFLKHAVEELVKADA
jgi:type I restriction enzyme R subunit